MKKSIFNYGVFSKLARQDIINVLAIVALWIFMVAFINPLGDFPLNDDWIYGKAVRSIVEQGDFTLSGGWAATNLFSQAFWGALFCWPFGFSFTALRFSTLTLGAMGVLATYGLLREVKVNRQISFMGALLIAVNPLYFGLSNTFMTDVPFFTVTTCSFYVLIRGLRKNSIFEVILAFLLSYIALLIRQLGLVIPLAFSCGYLMKKGLNLKNFIISILPSLLGIIIQLTYQIWLNRTGRISAFFNLNANNSIENLLSGNFKFVANLVERMIVITVYLGLFLFPLIIIFFLTQIKAVNSRLRSLILFSLSVFFFLVIGSLLLQNRIMPLSHNILLDFGLGPLTLHDTYVLELKDSLTPMLVKVTWAIMTVIGVIGAALLLYYLFLAVGQIFHKSQENKSFSHRWLITLVLSAIFIYVLPIAGLQPGFFYDRYLLLLLPLLMIMIVVASPGIERLHLGDKTASIVLILILIFGLFTIGATHDYLSWNRVRWQALNNLMQESQVSPNHIDGGYEFNGWYLYTPNYRPEEGKSWWWVDKDEYIIAFSTLSGYEQIRRYPIKKWLPIGPKNIVVLHKNGSL